MLSWQIPAEEPAAPSEDAAAASHDVAATNILENTATNAEAYSYRDRGKVEREQGKSVVLGAGDTFRAAAVEQLTIWSKRIGVDIVKQATGADPAAVAYDAADAALARGADVLIIDTAGRLHTQQHLMLRTGGFLKPSSHFSAV